MSEGFMNFFIISWYLIVLGSARSWAELRFVANLNEKSMKPATYFFYVLISRIPAGICFWIQTPYLGNLVLTGILLLFSVKLLRLSFGCAALSCMMVFVLGTFFEGYLEILMNPLSTVLHAPNPVIQLAIQMLVSILLLAALLVAYFFIVRFFPLNHSVASSSTMFTMLPCALIVWAIRLSMEPDTAYHAKAGGTSESYFTMFIWLGVSAIAFFSILAANHKTAQLITAYHENRLLERESRIQSQNAKEAMRRWEDTRSYQHDIRNHLLVVSGLLKKTPENALEYLNKLVAASDELSPKISTGSAALDILLEEKAQYAQCEGISICIDFQTQFGENIDELDLCVLFANGIDNALNACNAAPGIEKHIEIVVKQKHKFILIQITNGTVAAPPPLLYGIGLQNIQKIAHKYKGSIQTVCDKNLFQLSILLCR